MIHNHGDEWMPTANLRSMEVESGSSSTVKADSGITRNDLIVSRQKPINLIGHHQNNRSAF